MKHTDGYGFAGELAKVLRDEGKAVADLLIPRECAICGRTLLTDERHLCIHCEADLPLTGFWERRNNPMSEKLNAKLQKNRTRMENNELQYGKAMKFSYAAALFFYHSENKYRRIPQRLKYLGDIQEGQYYAGLLGKFLKDSVLYKDIDMIIPVPLHWSRRWSRGYNQAEVVAREIGMATGAPVRTDILERRRRTRTQTVLDPEAKSRNVMSAFSVKSRVRPTEDVGHVLLVDDVFTTGATMAACMDALQDCFGCGTRISAATLGFVSAT